MDSRPATKNFCRGGQKLSASEMAVSMKASEPHRSREIVILTDGSVKRIEYHQEWSPLERYRYTACR